MMRRPDLDDLDREMRDHIDAETQDNIARGMAPDEARAAAIRKFGNVTRVKEDVRGVWVRAGSIGCGQDARDAARRLRRNPGFALAIVVDAGARHRPAPPRSTASSTRCCCVRSRTRIRIGMVWLTTRSERDANRGGPASAIEIMNEIDFATWQPQATSFEHMIAYDSFGRDAGRRRRGARVRVVLGVRRILGRQRRARRCSASCRRRRIDRRWPCRTRLSRAVHSDPQVIGRAMTIDGRQMTIGAVLPEDFQPQLPGDEVGGRASDRVEPDAFRGDAHQPAAANARPKHPGPDLPGDR